MPSLSRMEQLLKALRSRNRKLSDRLLTSAVNFVALGMKPGA